MKKLWGLLIQNNLFVDSSVADDGGLNLVGKTNQPQQTLLEILSFATSHYATSMQLVVICNYLSHVCNYKFGIV